MLIKLKLTLNIISEVFKDIDHLVKKRCKRQENETEIKTENIRVQ